MIVPEFWTEGRVQHREAGKQVTVRRFGWSDTSPGDAQAMADTRAREALERILAGDKSSERHEPKVPYNGAEGVPIREEVVSRHGDAVITRNSYGARCLNTPNVLFVDVDFSTGEGSGCLLALGIAIVLSVTGFLTGGQEADGASRTFMVIGSMIVGGILAWAWMKLGVQIGGGAEAIALRRVKKFLGAHPDWNARLYRTPAGFRVMAVHRTFVPDDSEVRECLAKMRADRVYVQMCRNQQCFRARLGAKPWRIGVNVHLKPRPGTWPVNPERLPERREWIDAYEKVAADFAACSWMEDIGSGVISPEVRPVMELHDRESRALDGLPIA